MTTFVESWGRPRAASAELAQWYYQGRGALAHADWPTAETALSRAVEQLSESGEWSLLWLCRLALATLAWRAEDGPGALAHAREAHTLADRLPGEAPRIWSLWLLGHLHAAHHRRADAAACFIAARALVDEDDEQQQSIRHLIAVAEMQCMVESSSPELLVERLFALAQLAARTAKRLGLPFEALESLAQAPVLARGRPDPARKPLEWLLQMLPRPAPAEREAPVETPLVPARPAGDAYGDESVPDLRAYCLGRFEVWLGHTLITQWAGTKGKLLLKLLLAAYPAAVPASRLMSVLWNGVEEELARQRLHTAISDLRRSLRNANPDAGALVISQNGSYGLDPNAAIWIDTLAFNRAQRAGHQYEQAGRLPEAQAAFREAVALYRGELFEEDQYEDWPIEQRERLKSEYLIALARLCQGAFAEGDYESCINWGLLTIECDPCREDAHALLMHCYSRLGQRAMALRQYRQCAEALRRELDAIPAQETEELYRRLQQGQEL